MSETESDTPNKTSESKGEIAVRPSNPGWSATIPWLAAIAAIVYATGFLIEFTFLSSFGIRDAATDLFKAQYIYIGTLCLGFPTAVGIVFVRYFRLRKPDEAERKGTSSFFLAMSLYLAFYLLVAFSPRRLFEEHQWGIFILFCVNMTGVLLTHDAEAAIKEREGWKKLSDMLGFADTFWLVLRRGLLFASLALIVFIFWSVWTPLWTMVHEGAWLYVALVSNVIFILWRVSKAISRGQSRVISFCHVAVYGYLSVLVFAHRVYPFIPLSRGGGDYSEGGALSVFTFDSHFSDSIPEALVGSYHPSLSVSGTAQPNSQIPTIQSKPVVILSESTELYFVLLPDQPYDSSEVIKQLQKFRMIGPENKPKTVYAIKRDTVTAITNNQLD
jgi:hypothetical protein